ncbi:MAG: calcium/sodium antiporter [Sphingobacteriaceae bacterium]|nr:calcium/sodium antiporter [Sphingobacteriaceae bacterium]
MIQILLLVVGLVMLVKGSDWLVQGASGLAKKYNVPDIVIGLTIVSFGTSLPELLVSLLSSFKGSSDIALGNVLGSNTANILLILGISAMIFPLSVKRNTTWVEIPISLMAAVLLGVLAHFGFESTAEQAMIGRGDGIILLLAFAGFMWYIFRLVKSGKEVAIEVEGFVPMPLKKTMLLIVVGIAGLTWGGRLFVDNAILLAQSWGVSEALIGLTVVAIGTSLPELATSAVAAYKKETDIAVGNVVGSNIFNILWILGLSASIKPLRFNNATNFDIATVIASSLLLFAVMFFGKKHNVGRWKGLLFVLLYIAYTWYLVQRG